MSDATDFEKYGYFRQRTIEAAQAASDAARRAYRCGVCHSWAFADGVKDGELPCPYCEAPRGLRLVGKIEGPRIQSSSDQSPCDYACTEARGNKCQCACLGFNHGKGSLITVVRDEGTVKVALVNAEKAARSADKIRVEVAEYGAAREALIAEIKRIFPEWEARAAGAYVGSWSRFMLADRLMGSIRRVSARHSHKGRMKALGDVQRAVEYEAKMSRRSA